jgi:hypothetical protein
VFAEVHGHQDVADLLGHDRNSCNMRRTTRAVRP